MTYQFALAGSAIKQEPAKAEYARFEQTAIAVSELFVRGTCQKSRIMYKNCHFWSPMRYTGVAAGIFDTFFLRMYDELVVSKSCLNSVELEYIKVA